MSNTDPFKWYTLHCGGCASVMKTQMITGLVLGVAGLTECVNNSCAVYGRLVLFLPDKVHTLGTVGPSGTMELRTDASRGTVIGLDKRLESGAIRPPEN